MISDRSLLKICAIVFVVGMLLLIYASQQQTAVLKVSDIRASMLGNRISVRGIAKDVTSSSSLRMTLIDEADSSAALNVIMFKPMENISEGERLIIYGEIDVYRGELEIVASKITTT